MKKGDTFLKEYAQRLSDENVRFLNGRLSQRLSGDLPEVLDLLSSSNDMNRWLGGAKSCWELYNMIDSIHTIMEKESVRRFGEAA